MGALGPGGNRPLGHKRSVLAAVRELMVKVFSLVDGCSSEGRTKKVCDVTLSNNDEDLSGGSSLTFGFERKDGTEKGADLIEVRLKADRTEYLEKFTHARLKSAKEKGMNCVAEVNGVKFFANRMSNDKTQLVCKRTPQQAPQQAPQNTRAPKSRQRSPPVASPP